MRERGQTRKVRRVVVTEDHGPVSRLVVVNVRETLDSGLRVDELSEVQLALIGAENDPSHISSRGAAFVKCHVVRLHDRRCPDRRKDRAEVGVYHLTRAPSNASFCSFSRRSILISPSHSMFSRLSAISAAT